MKTVVVVNPASARGRTGRLWPQLSARFRAALGELDVKLTTGPGQATELVRAALAAGTERIIAIGGDGTNHEVINGFFDADTHAPLNPDAIFAFCVSGTGGDFARTFPAASDIDAQLGSIANSPAHPIDLIGCTYTTTNGTGWEISNNIASIGQGGDVCARVDASTVTKRIGSSAFLISSMESLALTRPWRVRLTVDGGPPREQAARNVIVANCRFHGGGMEIAPMAVPDDGELDLVVLGDLSRLQMLALSRDIYRGRAHEHMGVTVERCKTVKVETLPGEPTMRLEMDGEARGVAPVEFAVLPGALRIAR